MLAAPFVVLAFEVPLVAVPPLGPDAPVPPLGPDGPVLIYLFLKTIIH